MPTYKSRANPKSPLEVPSSRVESSWWLHLGQLFRRQKQRGMDGQQRHFVEVQMHQTHPTVRLQEEASKR